MERHYTWLDRVCLGIDNVIRTLSHRLESQPKPSPAANMNEDILSDDERKQAASLMRVNHSGEVCAQALYQGHSAITKNATVKQHMQQAAIEEGDHLAWTKERIIQLSSHTSYFNPFWYAGSFCIGILAGIAGDKYSYSFVAETEKQVIKHLEKHLQLLPANDHKSRQILMQMETDEAKHRDDAIFYGAKELPKVIQLVMRGTSKVMVGTAYYF